MELDRGCLVNKWEFKEEEDEEIEDSEFVDINRQTIAFPVEGPSIREVNREERSSPRVISRKYNFRKNIIKNEIFTVIETKKIIQEFEEYLRKNKVFSFFFIVKMPDEKLIQKLSEVFEEAFVAFVSSYDREFLYYFIGGDMKNDLKKTLRDWKYTLEGYDSQIALISITFYEDYFSLLLDRTEKIIDGVEGDKGFKQYKFRNWPFKKALAKIKMFLEETLLN